MSQIILKNNTQETVRLAVFQRPVRNPTLATIAWQIAAPPPGGSTRINIPSDFSLRVRYSDDPKNPRNLVNMASPVNFDESTAAFKISGVTSQDGQASGAVIHKVFTDLVLNEVHITNDHSIGIEAAILRGEDPIYPPQVIWPSGRFMEDVRATLCVAVISQFTCKGDRLVQQEISRAMTDVMEGNTVVVNGCMWTGYSLEKL